MFDFDLINKKVEELNYLSSKSRSFLYANVIKLDGKKGTKTINMEIFNGKEGFKTAVSIEEPLKEDIMFGVEANRFYKLINVLKFSEGNVESDIYGKNEMLFKSGKSKYSIYKIEVEKESYPTHKDTDYSKINLSVDHILDSFSKVSFTATNGANDYTDGILIELRKEEEKYSISFVSTDKSRLVYINRTVENIDGFPEGENSKKYLISFDTMLIIEKIIKREQASAQEFKYIDLFTKDNYFILKINDNEFYGSLLDYTFVDYRRLFERRPAKSFKFKSDDMNRVIKNIKTTVDPHPTQSNLFLGIGKENLSFYIDEEYKGKVIDYMEYEKINDRSFVTSNIDLFSISVNSLDKFIDINKNSEIIFSYSEVKSPVVLNIIDDGVEMIYFFATKIPSSDKKIEDIISEISS